MYLTCVAYGDLPLSVSWLRGDREVSNSSRVTVYGEEQVEEEGMTYVVSVVEICGVERSDVGRYSCVAENGHSRDSSSLDLRATDPSPPAIVVSSKDLIINSTNSTVALTCVAIGDPNPVFSWAVFSEEGLVDPSALNFSSSLVIERGWEFVQSTIFLCSDFLSEFTSVQCVATNRFGADNATMLVTVASKHERSQSHFKVVNLCSTLR